MRLIDYEEFCRMPAGTIFAPYQPCVLENYLAIKVDPGHVIKSENCLCREHFFNGVMPLEPWIDGCETKLWSVGDREEATFEIFDGDNNDYSNYKMFLVFEEPDIDRMINVLVWAKSGCKETLIF